MIGNHAIASNHAWGWILLSALSNVCPALLKLLSQCLFLSSYFGAQSAVTCIPTHANTHAHQSSPTHTTHTDAAAAHPPPSKLFTSLTRTPPHTHTPTHTHTQTPTHTHTQTPTPSPPTTPKPTPPPLHTSTLKSLLN